jgi:hypothetical protein
MAQRSTSSSKTSKTSNLSPYESRVCSTTEYLEDRYQELADLALAAYQVAKIKPGI